EYLIVQRRQSLQWRIGAGPAVAADFAAGGIEGHEGGIGGGAAPEGVQAAAILVATAARDPLVVAVRVEPDAVRLIGENTWSTHFPIQQTADRQGVVANQLGLHAEPGTAGVEP